MNNIDFSRHNERIAKNAYSIFGDDAGLMVAPRYQQSPDPETEGITLNDADSAPTPLQIAFAKHNERIAGNAFKFCQ